MLFFSLFLLLFSFGYKLESYHIGVPEIAGLGRMGMTATYSMIYGLCLVGHLVPKPLCDVKCLMNDQERMML